MSDMTPPYGMILLGDGRPTLLRARGWPVFVKSPRRDDGVRAAARDQLLDGLRRRGWLVAAQHPEWTAAPIAAAKNRVDITLCPGFGGYAGGRFRGWSARGGAGWVPLREPGQALVRRSADLSPEIAVLGRVNLGSE